MSAPLTRRAFRAWLESKPPEAGVGVPGLPCDCPLARFLKSGGAVAPTVGVVCYRRNEYSKRVGMLPLWAGEFAERLDARYEKAEDDIEVTAAEALGVLDWDAP